MTTKEKIAALRKQAQYDRLNRENIGNFQILRNDDDELLIIVEMYDSEPENPLLIYDAGQRAILYRNRESLIFLSDLEQAAREGLLKVAEVIVAEIQSDDCAREYRVPVKIIESLDELLKD